MGGAGGDATLIRAMAFTQPPGRSPGDAMTTPEGRG
jgi:hypothetical protein